MNINVKRKNLFLIDDISPYKNFINARKTLRNIYLKSRKKEEEQKARTIVTRNNNIYQNIKIKLKTEKTPMKPYSQKLLKDQKFIISHLFKENEIKNDL